MKSAIDWQLQTFAAGIRPAAMFITAFDVILVYLAILFGWQRKPSPNEVYWLAAIVLALAWVASDVYVFAVEVVK